VWTRGDVNVRGGPGEEARRCSSERRLLCHHFDGQRGHVGRDAQGSEGGVPCGVRVMSQAV
jgi:hypothetical protein